MPNRGIIMEIKESNKIIAEFMEDLLGYKKFMTYLQRNGFESGHYEPEKMKYHKSWDWLMPVKEKIEFLPGVFDFTISSNSVSIEMIDETEYSELIFEGQDPIDVVYKLIVNFIKDKKWEM